MKKLSGSLPGELSALLDALGPGLKSHPDKTLQQHLMGVLSLSSGIHTALNLPINKSLIQLTALTHDVGKAHPQFQSYISGREKEGIPHAAPSAWWTLALGYDLGLPLENVIWAAEVVRRHHTGLVDFHTGMLQAWNSDDAVASRVETWNNAQILVPKIDTSFCTEGLPKLDDLFWDIDHDPGAAIWLNVRLLYSLLIAADRMDAIGIEEVNFDPLPKWKAPIFDEPDAPINQWRQRVQEDCFSSAIGKINKPGVYSLSLPTGAGKTVTGLRIAADLAQRLDLASLIYVLPFISIVEQTADNARKCFPENLIQEDHSLVPLNREDNTRWQHMTAMFRHWHQPVVITTMAQLWESLFNPRANRTMNFHHLSKAVVILDEPQTLPPKYWSGLGQLFDFLAKQLGSYFILMTATQPHISRQSESGCELSPHVYHFPEVRHRYQVCHIDSPVSTEELRDLFITEKLLEDSPAGMLVLNTKRSALNCFNLIKEWIGKDIEEIELLFLSAWLTPWKRRKILEKLRQLEREDHPRILISTQVVEAGVDLDFDWVVRDLGPLDSIIQVAGRCNRHNKRRSKGRVYTTYLHDDRERTFAGYVYDIILLEATRDVLLANRQFDEKDVPAMIDSYYSAILDRLTPVDIMGGLAAGKWEYTPELYPGKAVPQIQLVMDETDEVPDLINQLENTHWDLGNLPIKRDAMRRLRQHIIEVPMNMKPSLDIYCGQILHSEPVLREILGGQMLLLSRKLIGTGTNEILYDSVKGFIPPDEDDSQFSW